MTALRQLLNRGKHNIIEIFMVSSKLLCLARWKEVSQNMHGKFETEYMNVSTPYTLIVRCLDISCVTPVRSIFKLSRNVNPYFATLSRCGEGKFFDQEVKFVETLFCCLER